MATIPDHVFRGYDIRGLSDTELTAENVEELGKTYATWLIQRRIPDCVVGYDCRLTSPSYAEAICRGLTSSGIHVINIGMTLSQIAYFAQYLFRTKGMVMVTASHNAKEYNGFKLARDYSATMLTDDINAFKQLYLSGNFKTTGAEGSYREVDIKQEYIADVLRLSAPTKKFRIVVDSCDATAALFLPDILRQAGNDVIELDSVPDGHFPVGTPDPTERFVMTRLADKVKAEKADLGFAYDADGDRIGVVDAEGELIWDDTLCALYAKDVLTRLPGSSIVFNVLCSKQLTETILASGGIPVICKTGRAFIRRKIQETSAVFGGELSGHFYFIDNFYGHDDSAIASLRLLSYLTESDQTLKEAVARLPRYISSPEIKVGCPDDEKLAIVSQEIAPRIRTLYPKAGYTDIDGIRMDTDTEMLIARASQNGPFITLKFEAKSQAMYDQLKNQISEILHSIDSIDFTHAVNVDSLT
jgi:phosphomannomutase / phosphoglucomutase